MRDNLLEYFNEDELAVNVWESKYKYKDEKTPDYMHMRMAKEFGKIEKKYKNLEKKADKSKLSKYGQKREFLNTEKIFNYFKDFKYIIPQGSVMATLGTDTVASLSNCFVLGQAEDSYSGIMLIDEQQVQLMKRRGGVGHDISKLRPAGVKTNNSAKSSTGSVSFAHRFSNSTREVSQNGRRGALMLSINSNHPDLMEFIIAKRDLTSITGANISVLITDEFMNAVEKNEDFLLRWPIESDISNLDINNFKYNELTEINENLYVRRIKSKHYWDELIKSARDYAEPGLMFQDKHWDYSPDSVYSEYKGVTSNPCGEIFMEAKNSCRLIINNLYSYVENPFTEKAYFNLEKFYEINYEAMRLSDNLVELELEYVDRIIEKIKSDKESETIKRVELELWQDVRKVAENSRRTGLGFTALGDMLAALNLKYDSDEALKLIYKVMYTKMKSELDCTIDLAILRNETFKGYNKDLEFKVENNKLIGLNPFYTHLVETFPEQAKRMYKYGRRNVSWNTVAPGGSVSVLSQTTSGIEPLFLPYYTRRKKVNPGEIDVRIDYVDESGDSWQEFPVLHPKFKTWIEINWKELLGDDVIGQAEQLNKEIIQNLFEQSPWYKSTANDIDWIKRLEIQSITQRFITHSISMTCNLPANVTYEEVSDIYMYAWHKNLKGVTVYRDGSRSGVLINENTKNNDNANLGYNLGYNDATKRPKIVNCNIHTVTAKGVKYNVIVGFLNKKPYEVFVVNYFTSKEFMKLKKLGKGKYSLLNLDESVFVENLSTTINDEQEAITRFVSMGLRHGVNIKHIVDQLHKTPGDMFAFTKGLARVLKKYVKDDEKSGERCENCGEKSMIYEEGCKKCLNCGSSKC